MKMQNSGLVPLGFMFRNRLRNTFIKLQKKVPFFELMLNTFNQRASMGSTDALSIIYRDIIINIYSHDSSNGGINMVEISKKTLRFLQFHNHLKK